jgi:hypothetical protein
LVYLTFVQAVGWQWKKTEQKMSSFPFPEGSTEQDEASEELGEDGGSEEATREKPDFVGLRLDRTGSRLAFL